MVCCGIQDVLNVTKCEKFCWCVFLSVRVTIRLRCVNFTSLRGGFLCRIRYQSCYRGGTAVVLRRVLRPQPVAVKNRAVNWLVRMMLVTHSCFREECRLTCPLGGAKFAQEARESIASHTGVFRDEIRAPLKTPAWEARESSADMKCDRNVCEQQYSFGRCKMKCLSSVIPGVCRQVCIFGMCESMTCNATQSVQICHDAKNCAQFGYVLLPGRITMKYDLPHWSINMYRGSIRCKHDTQMWSRWVPPSFLRRQLHHELLWES